MQRCFGGPNIKFMLTPPGKYDQATSQKVALTYFQAKPNIQVFGYVRRPDGRRRADARSSSSGSRRARTSR